MNSYRIENNSKYYCLTKFLNIVAIIGVLIMLSGIITTGYTNKYNMNHKKIPAFSKFPVFEIEFNKKNVINLKDYLLIDSDNIKKIDIKEYSESLFSDIKLDKKKYELIFRTNKNSGTGHIKINISLGKNRNFEICIFINVIKKNYNCDFLYPAENKNLKVAVAGDFNGWNSNADILKYSENKNGYTLSKKIKPGNYKYKFVIDNNKWIPDETNQNKSPDGFGGYNSILKVGKSDEYNIEIIPLEKEKKIRNYKFEFYYKNNGKQIKTQNIYFVVNNVILDEIEKVKENELEFKVNKKQLADQVGFYPAQSYNFKAEVIVEINNKSYYSKSFFINLKNKYSWKDAVLYFIFVDRFFDSTVKNDYKIEEDELAYRANFHGGDFSGIIKKIKQGFFNDLGINSIWLSPVVQNPKRAYRDSLPPHRKFTGYHGYWPIDSYKIAENFGTLDELKKLVDTAHKHNIRILIDYVANHVHKDHPLYKEHPEYFGKLNLPDGRKNIRLFDDYPLTTWFDEFLPSFDFSKKQAVDYIINNADWLVNQTNIDGFRLDAVKHIPHDLWLKLRKRIFDNYEVKDNKKFYMVGESISGRDKIMEYVSDKELDGQFDFPLYWTIRSVFAAQTQDFHSLKNSLMESLESYGNDSIMSVFLGNHDFSRFMAYADNEFKPDSVDEKEYGWTKDVKVDDPKNYDKIKLGFSFILTIPGVPLIYYGDEFGMTGAHDPDNRRDMRFDNNLTKSEKEVKEYVKKIIKIRNNNPVFRYGDVIPLSVSNEYFVYLLSYFNTKAIVVLSRNIPGNQIITVNIPGWVEENKLINLIDNKKIKIDKGNKINLILSPMNTQIYLIK